MTKITMHGTNNIKFKMGWELWTLISHKLSWKLINIFSMNSENHITESFL